MSEPTHEPAGSNSNSYVPTAEFLAACEAAGVLFDPGDLEKLEAYLRLLLETNRQFNLTAVTDPAQGWMRHIYDALTLLPLLDACAEDEAKPATDDGAEGGAAPTAEPREDRRAADRPKQVIDVGSGGGLPGIPLAVARPDVRFTLLEATGKKAEFLARVTAELGLSNVEVLRERAETVGQDHRRWRERFDAVMARAVGPLPVLLELTVPLARVGGVVLAIKGERAGEEIEAAKAALHALHAAVIDTIRTPTGTIVVIEKRRPTPRLYPRLPGEPKRRPLGGARSGE